jgi:hypothetical protein
LELNQVFFYKLYVGVEDRKERFDFTIFVSVGTSKYYGFHR